MKKTLGVAVSLLIIGGGAYWYFNNAKVEQAAVLANQKCFPYEPTRTFICPAANECVGVSDNGISDVIAFSKNDKPIPSRVYVDRRTNELNVYHDDQYDPALQRENIQALQECTSNGKNFFEIYDISPEELESKINEGADQNPLN